MIELVSVELENFRAFSNATFAPLGLGQGMTAINGSNGSGKSSIVYAICFGLYGITPDGVPVRALRKQGSEGEVKVSITFRHAGQTIVVTRMLRGRNDTTLASIVVDGVEETAVSTRAATSWIVNRLGLDSEAFLTAFVVQQKELDSLIKARPAERRKVIERLAGIERMSAALEVARTNAKSSQKLLEAIPLPEDPELVKDKYSEAVENLEKLGAAILVCEENEASGQNALNISKAKATEASNARNALSVASHTLELIEQKKASYEKIVIDLTSASAGHEFIEDAREEASKARKQFSVAEQVIANLSSFTAKAESDQWQLRKSESQVSSLREDMASYGSEGNRLDELLATFPADLDQEIELKNTSIIDSTQEKGALLGEYERIQKAITTLKSTSGTEAHCPTCLQALESVSNLITSLETTLADIKRKGETVRVHIVSLESERTSLLAMQEKKSKALNEKLTVQKQIPTAKANLENALEVAKEAFEAAKLSQEVATQGEEDAQQAKDNLLLLQEMEEKAQKRLRECESALEAYSKISDAQTQLNEIVSSFGIAEAEHDIATESWSAYDINKIEQEIAEATIALKATTDYNAGVKAEYPLAISMVEMHKEKLKLIEESIEKRKNAMERWENDSRVSSTLDEFRRDRLSRLAPEISEVASDLISTMTEGRYTSLELDEDFTPILTEANGTQRPSAWLSGGEESAVALALRIAIGEILAGQRGGLLVLDEVLTAQDTFRRQATMNAIRSLPRQIITINHVSEATDMVDLVSNVISDGEGSSAIVDSVPSEFVGTDISDQVLDG